MPAPKSSLPGGRGGRPGFFREGGRGGPRGWGFGGGGFVVCLADRSRVDLVVIVVPRHIAGLLRVLQLGPILGDDSTLNLLATVGVDRVGNVGVELGASLLIANRAVILQSPA